MIVANTNYLNSLLKIEQLKTLILELEENIYNQIPQEITNQFENSKLRFLNSIDEIEMTLTEFNNRENE